jgi:broad specificity phosphatase PhoE
MILRFPAFLVLLVALLPAHIAGQSGPALVILVRHAEKAPAPADDPPLSEAGRLRAAALSEALAETRIDAVVTTEYARTRDTASPVVAVRRSESTIVRARGRSDDAHVAAVVAAVRDRKPGEAVLVVGHSNTIPAIIGALGGPKMPALCDTEYANLFILSLTGGAPRLVRGYYGAQDPPNAADCNRAMKQRGQ